jgi:hypothetical protein
MVGAALSSQQRGRETFDVVCVIHGCEGRKVSGQGERVSVLQERK